VISRATCRDRSVKKRMGWKFKWVSSSGTDFILIITFRFPRREGRGQSLLQLRDDDFPRQDHGRERFYQNEAANFSIRTPCYARGLISAGAYNFLDLTPKGRRRRLTFSMAWVFATTTGMATYLFRYRISPWPKRSEGK